MAEIGFVPRGEAWRWPGANLPRGAVTSTPVRAGDAFAALAKLKK